MLGRNAPRMGRIQFMFLGRPSGAADFVEQQLPINCTARQNEKGMIWETNPFWFPHAQRLLYGPLSDPRALLLCWDSRQNASPGEELVEEVFG